MNTRYLLKLILSALIPAILVPLLHFTGFWIWAGAHPFWSLSGGLRGLAIGLVLFMVLSPIAARIPAAAPWAGAGFAALTIAAAITALVGKQGFAASYAEDAFAGRLWFLGYIAAMTALTAALATMALAVQLRNRRA